MRDASAPVYVQAAFDELDEPLREVTFVVVDLETTGGGTDTEAITEIGAVKVRGGEVLGEFATLVDPGRGIPPLITVLTGITDLMVASRAADRGGAAGVPRVRPGHRAGRPQRAVRRRLPQGRLRPAGAPLASRCGWSTPRCWPAGC